MELFLISEDGCRAVAFDPSGPWHGWTFLRDFNGQWVSEQQLQREPLPLKSGVPGVVLGGAREISAIIGLVPKRTDSEQLRPDFHLWAMNRGLKVEGNRVFHYNSATEGLIECTEMAAGVFRAEKGLRG